MKIITIIFLLFSIWIQNNVDSTESPKKIESIYRVKAISKTGNHSISNTISIIDSLPKNTKDSTKFNKKQ